MTQRQSNITAVLAFLGLLAFAPLALKSGVYVVVWYIAALVTSISALFLCILDSVENNINTAFETRTARILRITPRAILGLTSTAIGLYCLARSIGVLLGFYTSEQMHVLTIGVLLLLGLLFLGAGLYWLARSLHALRT